jgi:hypothetical protein
LAALKEAQFSFSGVPSYQELATLLKVFSVLGLEVDASSTDKAKMAA